MTQTFPCVACGAPNFPEAGQIRMACTYCGTNLTIPEHLRIKPKPTVVSTPARGVPTPSLEKDAPELLRKAQPIAVKAWNSYVYWTWLRRLIPACLSILIIGFLLCVALGVLPFILGSLLD